MQLRNDISGQVVDAAFAVHKELGPGLLESTYEQCLAYELSTRNLLVERQVAVPMLYKGQEISGALRLDLLIGGQVIVEVKACEQILPLHEAQLLTYLRFAHRPLGLLINFNVTRLKNGIRRLVLTEQDRQPGCVARLE